LSLDVLKALQTGAQTRPFARVHLLERGWPCAQGANSRISIAVITEFHKNIVDALQWVLSVVRLAPINALSPDCSAPQIKWPSNGCKNTWIPAAICSRKLASSGLPPLSQAFNFFSFVCMRAINRCSGSARPIVSATETFGPL